MAWARDGGDLDGRTRPRTEDPGLGPRRRRSRRPELVASPVGSARRGGDQRCALKFRNTDVEVAYGATLQSVMRYPNARSVTSRWTRIPCKRACTQKPKAGDCTGRPDAKRPTHRELEPQSQRPSVTGCVTAASRPRRRGPRRGSTTLPAWPAGPPKKDPVYATLRLRCALSLRDAHRPLSCICTRNMPFATAV